MPRANGNRELSYNARLNIDEIKKNALLARKYIDSISKAINSISPASTTGFTTAQVRMTKAMRDSLAETQRLVQEGVRLRNEYEQGRISAQQLTAQTRLLNEQRRAEAAALREARRNQVAANGSYQEARQRMQQLLTQIRSVGGGLQSQSPLMRARIDEYRRLNAQLTEFDRRMGMQRGGGMQNGLNALKGLAATYLSAQAVFAGGKKILDLNIELSDSLSDVQRTAGLTAVEAENLSDQLKKIDTRTSLKGLADIAVIGGQLGIAKDQLAGFTAAVNQLAVSLSGELKGGAEGIAKSLGVLDNIFGITQKNAGNVEKSYNQIGSAILGLGQSGLATGDFLADFSERVGGLAKQAGLSLPVILSYGAVLQENGVSAEVAGSSFKRLLNALTTNREKFFAVAQLADANLTLKSFTNTINTDAKKALDLFFAGLAKGGKTTTSFNDILKSLKLSGAGVSQTVAALSHSQQELNGHVEQATKDFDAATLSAQQYAIKNDNLAGSWDKLGNTIKNAFTSGPISGFFKVVIDGLNSLTQKMFGLTKSRSWNEFFTRITPFTNVKGFDAANQINDNYKQRASLSYDLNSIYDKKEVQGVKVGLEELKKAYTEAYESQKQAAADYQLYQAGLKDGTLRNTNGQLEALRNQFFYVREQTAYFAKEYKAARALLPKVKGKPVDDSNTDFKVTSKTEQNALAAAIKSQRDLQAKIDDELAKSKRKTTLEENAQEIDAIKKHYADLRRLADNFNNDPKNKTKGISVDAGGLKKAETADINLTVGKQATEKLKTELENSKKLYADFEDYRTKFGLDKAKERYAKLIDTDKTYIDKLSSAWAVATAQGYKEGFGPAITERISYLNENIKIETEAEKKKHDALLFDLQTYAAKRKSLQEAMEKEVLALKNKGEMAEAEEARKRYQKTLLEEGQNHVQQLESYRKFFEDVDGLTSTEMAKRLKTLKEDISKLDSPELKEFLNKILRAGQIQLNTKTIDGYRSIVSSLQEAAQASEGLSAGLSEGLNMAVKLGAVFVDIKASFDQFKQAKEDNNPLGILTAGIAGVSSVLSIVNMVSGLFAKARAFKEENQKVINDFNNKRFFAEFDINQLYRERLRTQLEINSVTISGLKMSTAELKKQLSENAADYKRISELLAKESFITGYKNTSGANLVVKQVAILESLAGKSYKDIEKLFMSGQLTDRAKELFTQLQKLQAEGVDIDKLLADNTKAIMEKATGTTAESIRDSIITGFQNGYRTAEDFADDFKSLMNSATRQIFKEFIDNQELAAFYKKYAEMAEQGALSDTQKIELKKLYDEMIGRINTKYEELKGVTGNDFLNDPTKNNTNSLSGSIKQDLTEATGTVVAGALNGVRLNQAQTNLLIGITNKLLEVNSKTFAEIFQLSQEKFAIHVKTEANTYRTANNTDRLQAIEAYLSSIDRKAGSGNAALIANGRALTANGLG